MCIRDRLLAVQAALEAGWTALAVLAVLTAVVAVVYYMRLVSAMWFRDGGEGTPVHSTPANWAIGLAAAATVALGLFPNLWFGLLDGARAVVVAAGL